MARFERILNYIKILKNKFGKSFHIHLYTSLELLTKDKISKLEEIGLDELSVHLDLYDKKFWDKLSLLKNTSMESVIEVPVQPKEEQEF